MGISTYGKGKTSSGEVKVTKDVDISLEGADVLIVEDIVDSGVTLNYLMHLLDQRKPRSIRIAALLDKPERRLRPVHVSTRCARAGTLRCGAIAEQEYALEEKCPQTEHLIRAAQLCPDTEPSGRARAGAAARPTRCSAHR
jgi:hypoxanthine phosphoribosyltransferase